MTISRNETMTRNYMNMILAGGIENPVLVDKYMPGVELEVDVISDGSDVLIPGIMEHIERAGVHSGDSIAVYPPYNLTDKFLKKICDCSEKLALALGTKGLVNIQYLIYEDELYVIEVNPRASRTVPYISKVTNVPMVDLASRIMLGEKLEDLGYGSGLYRTPPYFACKVPVFSFEKLSDANSILGPEMKSTGEVLGIGKTLAEALFKGLTAAGFNVPSLEKIENTGILFCVEENDYQEILSIAKRFSDMGIKLYATKNTAAAIRSMGLDVTAVASVEDSTEIYDRMEAGDFSYIIYSGAVKMAVMGDYTVLHRRAMQLNIPCLTSLDTAGALAEILASRFTMNNTELVDINHMRTRSRRIPFTKMQSLGNDSIFIENFDNSITCPESLCVTLLSEHYGIGGDSIVMVEHSTVADAKMRVFNHDGTEGQIGGNNLRSVAKYLYDHEIVNRDVFTIETGAGVKKVRLFTRNGKASSVEVDMGKASLKLSDLPCTAYGDMMIGGKIIVGEKTLPGRINIGGRDYEATCVSLGNPHCVVFEQDIEKLDVRHIGPKFEHALIFPERVNTEFVRVVNATTLRMRVWERGNGETLACGSGACAAVVAAVENGFCEKDKDITVKLDGGDVIVRYSDDHVILSGSTVEVFSGTFEY